MIAEHAGTEGRNVIRRDQGRASQAAAAAGQDKLNSSATFPTLDPQYQTAEQKIEWLKAHPDATVRAVHWGAAAGGPVGQVAGSFGVLDQDTKDARGILDQLNDINFRSGLSQREERALAD